MKLSLQRIFYGDKSTLGKLYIDDAFACFTLELPYKHGEPGSAIPEGTFPVELRPSPKFLASDDPWARNYAYRMPHIQNIPGRSLIMIHWGNEPENTEGCVLVGLGYRKDYVSHSREAFAGVFDRLLAGEDLTITVERVGTTQQAVQQAAIEG